MMASFYTVYIIPGLYIICVASVSYLTLKHGRPESITYSNTYKTICDLLSNEALREASLESLR